MNCPNCGTNINQGENFCRMCGTQVVFPVETNTITTPNAFEQKPINEQLVLQENTLNTSTDISNSSNQKIEENITVVDPVITPTEIPNNTQNVPNAFNQKPMSAESIIEQKQADISNTIIENQTNIQPIVYENNINTLTEIPNSINQISITTSETITQNQINSENNLSTNPTEIIPTIVPVESQNTINAQNIVKSESNTETPIMSSDEKNKSEEKTKYPIEETLLNAYIGVNVEKIKDGSFSWSAFLFGIEYTLYRKMWLLSIIWFVGLIIIAMFLPSFSNIISFIINFVIALQFKDWYINHAVEKIKKIKLDNPNASEEELIKICRKKGGTSIIAALSPSIILIILSFAAAMLSGKLENSKVNTSEYLRTNIIREKI